MRKRIFLSIRLLFAFLFLAGSILPVQAKDPPTGEIRVLCMIDGSPVPDQEFSLTGASMEQSQITDEEGIAVFSGLPDGDYRISGKSFSLIEVSLPFEDSRQVQVEAKHEKPDAPSGHTKPEDGKKPSGVPGEEEGLLPKTGEQFYPIVFGLVGMIVFGICLVLFRKRDCRNGFLACLLVSAIACTSGICVNQYWNAYGKLQSKEALTVFDELPDALPGEGKKINDSTYIGKLSIPKLDKNLPIQDEWTDKKGKVSPCRYEGSADSQDLIIAGHSSAAHFGYLLRLKKGDPVYFTDASGVRHTYQVQKTERIHRTDVEEMKSKDSCDWDLTLFTCTSDSRRRITVRLSEVL